MIAFSTEGNSAMIDQSSTATNFDDTEGLRPSDILCGRCKKSINHVGTRRFRVTINLNLQRYLDATFKQEKTALIVSIVHMLRKETGARFLIKTMYNNKGSFVELSEKEARETVGRSLRDMAAVKQKSTTKDWTQQRTKKRAEAKSTSVFGEQVFVLDEGKSAMKEWTQQQTKKRAEAKNTSVFSEELMKVLDEGKSVMDEWTQQQTNERAEAKSTSVFCE
jgi:hypothetical protein